MSAQGQDPNRIDVSLNIMSDATLTAVNNLTNQLSSLREFLAAQGMTDPAAQAAAAGQWTQAPGGGYSYTHPGTTQAGIFHGPSQPIIQGQPSNPSGGADASRQRAAQLRQEYQDYIDNLRSGAAPDRPLAGAARDLMGNEIGDIQRFQIAGMEKKAYGGSRMDRFFGMYPGITQRSNREDRTFEDLTGQPGPPMSGGGSLPSGMGSGGGSYPPQGPPTTSPMGDYGDMPGWMQTLQREGITPESRFGFTIPRLGEFTIQDKLNMAAQWIGRAAQRGGTVDPTTGQRTFGTTATIAGRTAAGASYLADQSAAIVAIQREWQRVAGFARGQEQGAESLGFSRESALGDIEIGGVGLRLGFPGASAASREGLREELTQRRVQAAPGVSGDEAARIRNIVAGMGYSGDNNERMQMDLFKHLMQRGIAPETVAPLVDQGLRQGNTSIAALRDTMVDLADAARNANQTLEATTEAAGEYAESVQNIGANYEAALRNAATFTRAGLDPRIAGQAMQSPMVQGVLTMQTGLPPQLQGIVGAPGVMQAMGTAIQQGLDLGAPFANMPDSTITSASGQRITVSTGRDAQIAMAAQTTGIPRQIIERYMRNPNFLQAGGLAQTMVGQMQDEIRGQTHHERQVPVYENRGPRNEVVVPGPNGLERRNLTPRTRIGTRSESYTTNLSDAQRRALESGSNSDQVVQYNELEQQMLAMDKSPDWARKVRALRKDDPNIQDRLRAAQRLIGGQLQTKAEPDYLVGLTDEARKILKIEKPKDRSSATSNANAGGAPANAAMQGPQYPSSSGSALSYGNPYGP